MRPMLFVLTCAALCGTPTPCLADADTDAAIKKLQAQVAALLETTQKQAARIAELERRARPALHSKNNLKWRFLLDQSAKWTRVGTLEMEIEVKSDSLVVFCANGHAICEPNPGGDKVDPGKWLSLSFFVDDNNSQMIQGFPLFHAPKLSWGQFHAHPNRNWISACTTQMCAVKAGKHKISLRAMQPEGPGRWHLNGMGMHVLVIPK